MLGQWPGEPDVVHPKRLLLIHGGSMSAGQSWVNMTSMQVEAIGIQFAGTQRGCPTSTIGLAVQVRGTGGFEWRQIDVSLLSCGKACI